MHLLGGACPTILARSRALAGTRAAPSLGMGHLPVDEDRPKHGHGSVGSSRAGLWAAGDQHYCSAAGAPADSPEGLVWGPGQVEGAQGT